MFNTTSQFTHTSFADLLILRIYCHICFLNQLRWGYLNMFVLFYKLLQSSSYRTWNIEKISLINVGAKLTSLAFPGSKVKLNVLSQELSIDNMELSIEKNSNVNFKIKWQPDKPDSYKYTIFFEVVNNAKLKFLVHCYGHCVAPPSKKPFRKPFTTLQPIKKEGSTKFAEDTKKTVTVSGVRTQIVVLISVAALRG